MLTVLLLETILRSYLNVREHEPVLLLDKVTQAVGHSKGKGKGSHQDIPLVDLGNSFDASNEDNKSRVSTAQASRNGSLQRKPRAVRSYTYVIYTTSSL
jgi:hypothetical protein